VSGALRIALAGKGGAGKTTISSTLARVLARRGKRVLVIDGDSNPNVAVALGIERERAAALDTLPVTLTNRRLNGAGLVMSIPEVVRQHGIEGPDGVEVVQMCMPQHADEGCMCTAHATVSGLLADAVHEVDLVTILDLEASPEHLSRGTTRHVDALLLITEPYYRSLETARRMAALAAELPIPYLGVVANKVRTGEDSAAIVEFCGRHNLPLAGEVPWSDAVTLADKLGVPVIDGDPDGAIVAAINAVADHLISLRPRESVA